MKWGIEVEGINTGEPMIFCDADAVATPEGAAAVKAAMVQHDVTHVYVSDNENVLDYMELGAMFSDDVVTLDVTCVKGNRPDNLALMLRNPTFYQILKLKPCDQIKFEKDRTVFVWSMKDVWRTIPSDFEGDIEL